MADEDSKTLLEELSAQFVRLGSHVGDVVDALTMTALRTRISMAGLPAEEINPKPLPPRQSLILASAGNHLIRV